MNIQSMRPHELVRLVMSVLREQRIGLGGNSIINYGLWKGVSQRSRQIISDFSPSEMSVIIFGLGKSKIRDTQLLAKSATDVFIPNLNTMTLNDISHVLSGFARVGVRNDILFDLASREIARKIHSNKTTLADIASIFTSFAKLNYMHPLLFEVLGKRAVLLIPQEQQQITTSSSGIELAQIVHSLARLEHRTDQRLLAVVASDICRKIDSLPVFAIASILDGYNKLGVGNQFLLEVGLDESFRRRHEFEPRSTAILLNTISKSSFTSRSGPCGKTQLLFDYFVSDIAKRGVGKFDATSVTLIANGIANYCVRNDNNGDQAMKDNIHKVFMSIGDRVGQLANELSPKGIARLVRAFGTVQVRHGQFLYNIPKHVGACINDFSLADIGMIMKGYALLGIRNDELLTKIPERIVGLLSQGSDSMHLNTGDDSVDSGDVFALTYRGENTYASTCQAANVRGTVHILEAYAMLMLGDRKVTNLLVQEINRNRHLLSREEILNVIPKSLNNLLINPPTELRTFLEQAVSSATCVIEDEGLSEINQLLNRTALSID